MTQDIPEEYDGLELGTRDDVLVSDDTEREYVEFNDKLYWFDFQEITWERKTDILDDNLEVNERTGEMDLDLRGYYRDAMEEVIVDSSIDGGIAIFLKGMKADFGQKLQELEQVPDPGAAMEDADEGKSEQQSEEAT